MPSRTVRDALADCPRLNSNSKNAKSTAGRTGCWAGRTVHLDPADLPRAGRRPVLKRITDRPQEARGLSIWKRIFLENFCQKPQILNKYQKPADRPPREPGLSAQHLKTDFSWDFQQNPFTKRNHHSSKCNACKFWSKWHYGKSSQWSWSVLIVRLSILSTRSFSIH
jgi:hypothetical protein